MVAIMATPLASNAESTFATGGGAQSTSARVDFQITIPRFVSLRVGGAAGAISQVTFSPTAAQMEAGGTVAGAGGDLNGGVVTATVRGNGGNVTLAASTLGALQSGTNTISWTEITTATTVSALTPPALADGASVSTTVTAAVNGVVNQSAACGPTPTTTPTWLQAGTYGGVNANNGRVTYTASVL